PRPKGTEIISVPIGALSAKDSISFLTSLKGSSFRYLRKSGLVGPASACGLIVGKSGLSII
ncbi:MAG: hypothetical protein M1368_06590, partial [Thaumarchaeota archaeon]|nr:hypothetical protein [Nitrososphaerota archaeon]